MPTLLDAGRALPAGVYAAAHEARLQFAGALAGLFEECALLLTPSMGLSTPPTNLPVGDPAATGLVMRFTAPFDFSGSPTISIPCGFTADGMPASLQLVARHLGEETLVAPATPTSR